MNAHETAQLFGQMTAANTLDARDYIGRTIKDNGQTWTLDSVNYAGVLYWRKGKAKKLFVISNYTVDDLARLFSEESQ